MRGQSPLSLADHILVTRNSAYHMRGTLCVAVSDVSSGRRRVGHSAVGQQLLGSFRHAEDGAWRVKVGEAMIGHRLYFSSDTLTTPLSSIMRAEPAVVEAALLRAA